MKQIMQLILSFIFISCYLKVNAGGCTFSIIAQGDTVYCENNSIHTTLMLSIGGDGECFCNDYNAEGIQWYKNDIAIAGANEASYYATDTGNYFVKLVYCGSTYVKTKMVGVHYEECTSIELPNNVSENQINVFPSLATDDIYLLLPYIDSKSPKYFLCNSLGETITILPESNERDMIRFRINFLPPGLYLLRIETNEGGFVGKFVKE